MSRAIRSGVTLAFAAIMSVTMVDWAAAQSIGSRVASVSEGVVTMSFAAREGVCGNGRNIQMHDRDDDDYWERDCEPGPVRVLLQLRSGEIADIDTYVGGRWRTGAGDATELGTVSAPEAADYFLSLVATLPANTAKDAIFPALIADSVEAWPELLRIAKDESMAREVRKNAVFWVGQAATEEAVGGLTDIVHEEAGDLEVKEHAVFALSQMDNDESVPILISIARTHENASVRKRAMFWLGQSDDPRALELFEEILLRRP
jgi:HEAT repeat protein